MSFRGQGKHGKHGKTITITSRVAIPPKSIRGDIARITFYYQKHYDVKFSKRQQGTFEEWNKEDPVSKEEIDRNLRIEKFQGWGNDLVK